MKSPPDVSTSTSCAKRVSRLTRPPVVRAFKLPTNFPTTTSPPSVATRPSHVSFCALSSPPPVSTFSFAPRISPSLTCPPPESMSTGSAGSTTERTKTSPPPLATDTPQYRGGIFAWTTVTWPSPRIVSPSFSFARTTTSIAFSSGRDTSIDGAVEPSGPSQLVVISTRVQSSSCPHGSTATRQGYVFARVVGARTDTVAPDWTSANACVRVIAPSYSARSPFASGASFFFSRAVDGSRSSRAGVLSNRFFEDAKRFRSDGATDGSGAVSASHPGGGGMRGASVAAAVRRAKRASAPLITVLRPTSREEKRRFARS
eukprot:22496-Pelagococcus_subviridis.AAC.4